MKGVLIYFIGIAGLGVLDKAGVNFFANPFIFIVASIGAGVLVFIDRENFAVAAFTLAVGALLHDNMHPLIIFTTVTMIVVGMIGRKQYRRYADGTSNRV